MERSTEFRFDGLSTTRFMRSRRKPFGFAGAPRSIWRALRYPVLLNSKSAALRIMIDRALAVRDLQMDIKFEVVHTHTLIALAAAGMGVGILPKIACRCRSRRICARLRSPTRH